MTSIRQAVILAGGQGTRLRPFTLTTPKPMIPIHGKPFLEHLIELLKKNGIEEIIILTGYLHEKIEEYFKDGKEFGLKIKYSFSPIEDETGTRIRKAKDLLDDKFLLLYSDNYWPLQLDILTSFYNKIGVKNLVTVYSNFDNATKSNILVGNDGLVKIYDKTRTEQNLNGVDIGFFILDKNIFTRLPKKNFSFEKIIIPRLIKEKQMSGYLTNHKYYGLSNPERIPMIEEFFKQKKIILLDRDGVINKKASKAEYVRNWNEFQFLPGAINALKLLTKKKYEIIIISNQAGIGRGVMTEEDLRKIHEKFLEFCKKEKINIKGIYYCPHNWDEGCFCRKPKPGMLFKAAADHYFDLTKAIFVGDDERDEQAGKAVNCKTMLVSEKQNLLAIVMGLV
ncbi:MAG: HAD-IIIA family hydrolase [Candidatus Parcubacteria bacterium]|nr:HAD-IIIA family hydrolase [Candidatus Parcubacteria bacterium]